jgi:plastocyanin
MTKKSKKQRQDIKNNNNNKFVFSKNALITISIIGVLVSIIGYFGIKSMIPVNGNSPVFEAPKNNFLKATHHPQSGYIFVGQSAGGSRKGFIPSSSVSSNNAVASHIGPTLYLSKGGLESIHFINEDYDTHSKHNFNIDEFNVHSKDLGYFQTQAITFIVDKDGTFEYYCSIHPEMKGKVVVM